jgi:putative restriction endonuclease
MTTAPTSIHRARLEKVASDNGFDRDLPSAPDWLGFASTQCPLRLWLAVDGSTYLMALSRANVAAALSDQGPSLTIAPPAGAVGGLAVSDIATLHRVVRRAFQLSKSLPDELLHAFEDRTRGLPDTTEAERLVVQRVGQNIFREGLLTYWEGRCAVTDLAVPGLLRASHIKPWADCESDAERLDVYNGLLLAPHLDAAFDRGFITFADDGKLVVSDSLDLKSRTILGLDRPLHLRSHTGFLRPYLAWHRKRIFSPSEEPTT